MATIINNVYFAYTKMKNPVTAIKKTNLEVSVQVVMSEDDADNLLEVCPSANVKTYKADAFLEKFKFEAPFKGQKKQYVASFKRMTSQNGVEFDSKYRPRVIHDGIDKTFDVEVANGSFGNVEYSTYVAKYMEEGKEVSKTICQLVGIEVTNLIEYVSEKSDAEGEGNTTEVSTLAKGVKLAEVPKGQQAVVKQSDAPAAPKKKVAKVEDDSSEESPF